MPPSKSNRRLWKTAAALAVAGCVLGVFGWAARPRPGWRAASGSAFEAALFIRAEGRYFLDLAGETPARLYVDGQLAQERPAKEGFRPRRMFDLEPRMLPVRLEYADSPDMSPHDPGAGLVGSFDIDRPFPLAWDVVYPPSTPRWRFTLAASAKFLAGVCLVLAFCYAVGSFLAPRTRRRFAFGAASAGIAIAAMLLLAEFALRLTPWGNRETIPGDIWRRYKEAGLGEPNTVVTYMGYLPHQVKEYETEVAMNSRGWRDSEYDFEKPDDTYRIVILGDSYVEGKEVAFENTFPELLEHRLREEFGVAGEAHGDKDGHGVGHGIDVIALAKGGTSTKGEIGFFVEEGRQYRPNLVVLAFYPGNDVRENSDVLNERYEQWLDRIYLTYIVPARLNVRTRLLKFPGLRLNRLFVDAVSDLYAANIYRFHPELRAGHLVSPDLAVYQRAPFTDQAWLDAWTETLDLLLRARDEVQATGAEFVMLFVHSGQVPGVRADDLLAGRHKSFDAEVPFKLLREFCRKHAIESVDLYPPLTEHQRKTGERYYWQHDAHWNETGHRIAAEELYKKVEPKVRAWTGE